MDRYDKALTDLGARGWTRPRCHRCAGTGVVPACEWDKTFVACSCCSGTGYASDAEVFVALVEWMNGRGRPVWSYGNHEVAGFGLREHNGTLRDRVAALAECVGEVF